MAKLYFRYGTMGSAKTLNLLAVAHTYRQQGKKVLLLKPDLDDRFGKSAIKSRAGLETEADVLVKSEDNLLKLELQDVNCVLVDEAQFLPPKQIDQLRNVAFLKNIPVICYGLRTDFKTKLFPGSLRLMEIADSIEEIKSTCSFCNKKATVHLKRVDGKAILHGPAIEIGAEEKYFSVCYGCYYNELKESLVEETEELQLVF